MTDLAQMMARHAQDGRVAWIGLRAARRAEVVPVESVRIEAEGLEGDHGRAGKRAVTLIQGEHVAVIAQLLGREVALRDLRRNIAVVGMNLAGLRHRCLRVGEAVVRIEGPCPPCSRMEETLGFGGYTAVRGHGGWYASVETPGRVALGDPARPA